MIVSEMLEPLGVVGVTSSNIVLQLEEFLWQGVALGRCKDE
jgi:hypothetical protein